jgi:hypothetical protein
MKIIREYTFEVLVEELIDQIKCDVVARSTAQVGSPVVDDVVAQAGWQPTVNS